jgi:hypothetical protein
MIRPTVALVTCADLPDLYPDDALVIGPLATLGITAEPAVWDDPTVDWSGYALVVLRSTWDYPTRRDEFLAWARGVPRLANPVDVVAWNTDKRYLADLADAGVPVVPTTWVPPGQAWSPPAEGGWVVKPSVGAGSVDAGRYDLADPRQRSLAVAHVGRLGEAGRTAMIQPYLSAVDTHGETGLLFVGSAYSHAIRKAAMLSGPAEPVEGLYKVEEFSARRPSSAEVDVATRALAAVPGGPARLLYARVDLIAGPDGRPLVTELELTEPSLFLATADGAAQRLAAAIAATVGS